MGTQKNNPNETPKHMLKLMGWKILTIVHSKITLSLTYVMQRVLKSPELAYCIFLPMEIQLNMIPAIHALRWWAMS